MCVLAPPHACSPRMATMNKPAYTAIVSHSKEKPALVFVSSRRQVRQRFGFESEVLPLSRHGLKCRGWGVAFGGGVWAGGQFG